MKKIIFLLLALCIVSVVLAATIIEVSTVMPDIEANFDDDVVLKQATLTYAPTNEQIQMDNRTTDNKTFFFTPKIALQNGFYDFAVNAVDEAGNPKSFIRIVLVNVEQPDIYFIKPPLGIAKTPIFDIEIGTTKKANCKANLLSDQSYDEMPDFFIDGTGDTRHKRNAFDGSALNINGRSVLPTLYVKCKDLDLPDQITEAELPIGYDNTLPIIEWVNAIENPVVTSPGTSAITVRVDDKAVCFINNQVFETQDISEVSTYTFIPSHTLEYAGIEENGVKTYSIMCKNLAGDSTDTRTITIEVALSDELKIVTVNSPKEFTTNPLIFDIATNKPASCTATLNENTYELIPLNTALTKHNLQTDTNVDDNKTYIVLFDCIGEEGSVQRSERFTVDDSEPTNLLINATACKETEVDLAFSALDRESSIAGYNYSVMGNDFIKNGFTSSNKVTVTGLNLVLLNTYSVKARALNKAGEFSSEVIKSFTFNPNTTIACQEKIPPVLSFNVTQTSYGVSIKILCKDNSGCDLGSIKYGKSKNSSCTPNIIGSNLQIIETTTVCAEALDIYQNKGTYSRLVSISGNLTELNDIGEPCTKNSQCTSNYCEDYVCTAASCTDLIKNGMESDIDCGGFSCDLCILGDSCLSNGDCESNYCEDYVCTAASCTDLIKNGMESDIDCGGDCDKCEDGASCLSDSDCDSGSCEFSYCTKGKETWDEWAEKNGIDATDRDGDADKDGLSNYDEYLNGTDPNNKDTDGDGYSDYEEINAGTDPLDKLSFPTGSYYNYLMLILGMILLITAAIMLYYFKIDQTTSMNIALLGIAAILLAIINWLLFRMPNLVLIIASILCLGGAGYLVYNKRIEIMHKFSGNSSFESKMPSTQGIQTESNYKAISQTQIKEQKEDIEATKLMIEMIKKEKIAKQRQKETLFDQFGAKKSEKMQKPVEKTAIIEQIKEEKVIPKKTKLELPKKEVKKESEKESEKESNMDRLTKLGGKKQFSELEKMKRKGEAFETLSKFSKSKLNDVFSKLPSSQKGIESLSDIEKNAKKKKTKK